MSPTLAQVSRESLWQRIESGEEFVLVDALSPMSYAMSHLPGAINLTPGWVDDRARHRIPDLDTEVVVYCESADCDSSVTVANRLIELGYRNVRHYAEGKRDWVQAGLPLEGGRVPAPGAVRRDGDRDTAQGS
jgi:rhodanese-related sulfurtransferase